MVGLDCEPLRQSGVTTAATRPVASQYSDGPGSVERGFDRHGGTFDAINGSIVADTLRLLERELFEADWQEAKERLGREPLAIELARTPAQRRADALVEMATRARTAPNDGRRPARVASKPATTPTTTPTNALRAHVGSATLC